MDKSSTIVAILLAVFFLSVGFVVDLNLLPAMIKEGIERETKTFSIGSMSVSSLSRIASIVNAGLYLSGSACGKDAPFFLAILSLIQVGAHLYELFDVSRADHVSDVELAEVEYEFDEESPLLKMTERNNEIENQLPLHF